MELLSVRTAKHREVIDITEQAQRIVTESGVGEGICFLHALHTTVGLSTADLDPGTDFDMLDAFENLIPKLHYRHPHDPAHVPDHILSTLIGTSLSLPFSESKLLLGTWQESSYLSSTDRKTDACRSQS